MKTLLDQYWTWLQERTSFRNVEGWVEITTPYLDRHNDYIQIYAKCHDGEYVLSDDGYTIEDLEQTGCKIDSPTRQQLLNTTLNGFGVEFNKKSLSLRASAENFALQKHNLIQAMLAVNDLFYLAKPAVENLFYEDVVSWLDRNEIRYTPSVKFSGKSGYDHQFDFVIPKSKTQPERILRSINRPNRNLAMAMVFSWIDTREVRSAESKAYAILNDTDRTITKNVRDAMTNYDIRPILWSKRDEVQDEFAA